MKWTLKDNWAWWFYTPKFQIVLTFIYVFRTMPLPPPPGNIGLMIIYVCIGCSQIISVHPVDFSNSFRSWWILQQREIKREKKERERERERERKKIFLLSLNLYLYYNQINRLRSEDRLLWYNIHVYYVIYSNVQENYFVYVYIHTHVPICLIHNCFFGGERGEKSGSGGRLNICPSMSCTITVEDLPTLEVLEEYQELYAGVMPSGQKYFTCCDGDREEGWRIGWREVERKKEKGS